MDSSHAPNPRRLTVGLEGNRLAMLLAVLHRHAGVSTFDQDVFVNAVGGVASPAGGRPSGAARHHVVAARPAATARTDRVRRSRPGRRNPARAARTKRLREAAKLGFSVALIPKANAPRQPIEGLEIWAVDRLDAALDKLR